MGKYLAILREAEATTSTESFPKSVPRVVEPPPDPPADTTLPNLQTENAGPEAEIDRLARADGRAGWTCSVAADSRNPLIPPEVRAKIESIEADARAKGWPPELLWNANFWDCPRGLAAVLDEDDQLVEVTADYITILKTQKNILRFQKRTS